MRKKFLSLALVAALCLSMTGPAVAASPPSELDMAAAYVWERGIMVGDQNGNLNLDAGLNRAQLAVILTRLSDETGDMGRNAEYYRTVCPFTDVPEWAMPYTGYPGGGLHGAAALLGMPRQSVELQYRLRQSSGIGTAPRRRRGRPQYFPGEHRYSALPGAERR